MNKLIVLALGVAALTGCEGARADTVVPVEQGVVVSISSATLAQDCAPPPAAASGKPVKGETSAKMDYRAVECRQSGVRLAVASGKVNPGPFTVEKAQLLDAKTGALLQTMTTRNPQVWSEGRYSPWNTVVKPNEKLQVSFDMNAPDWSKLGGSQLAAQGKVFRLEMTVRVGSELKKIGATVRSAELMIDHMVDT